jgi:hypothetical protein
MPIALIIEIIQALASLAPQIPEVVALVDSATSIVSSGAVTPAQEASARAALDAMKVAIDAA